MKPINSPAVKFPSKLWLPPQKMMPATAIPAKASTIGLDADLARTERMVNSSTRLITLSAFLLSRFSPE